MAEITITIKIDSNGVAVSQDTAPASPLALKPKTISSADPSLDRTSGRVVKWTRLRASFGGQSGGEGPRTGP